MDVQHFLKKLLLVPGHPQVGEASVHPPATQLNLFDSYRPSVTPIYFGYFATKSLYGNSATLAETVRIQRRTPWRPKRAVPIPDV